MSKKSILSKSGQVSVSVLSKEVGSKSTSKKTALLSKKIMLTLALGACFFAVQNPVMAAEVTVSPDGSGYVVSPATGHEDDRGIYGGYSDVNGVTVSGNTVTVTGGTVDKAICGGYWGNDKDYLSGNAIDNKVIIKDGHFYCVYGGSSKGGNPQKDTPGEGVTKGNTLTIYDGTFDGEVAAGDGGSNCDSLGGFLVESNILRISGGTFNGRVQGGCATYGDAIKNEVYISGGSYNASIHWISGGYGENNKANGNKVTISGAETVINTGVYGGYGDEEVNCNEVLIQDGTITGNVYGGYEKGGYANNNSVTINGGTVNGTVYGAWSRGVGSVGVSEDTVLVTGNSVNINGGTVNGDVYAGWSGDEYNDTKNEEYPGGMVTDNVVNLSGGKVTGTVYGGERYDKSKPEKVYGNTLNVRGLDIEVGTIKNFDNINFFIPSSATDGSIMLTLTGIGVAGADGGTDAGAGTGADVGADVDTSVANNVDITNLNVKAGVVAIEGDSKLQVGDTVTLLKNAAGELITADADDNEMEYGKLTAQEGVSVDYEFDILKQDDWTLVATINAVPEEGLKPQTKSLVETQAAGMAMLNGGMDMLAGEGIANAISAAADASGAAAGAGDGAGASSGGSVDGASASAGDGAGADGAPGKGPVGVGEGREFAMFGMLGASNMKYKTGSHVDLDGWNLGLGFAKTVENNAGKLTFGPVVSYGKGSYDSYLDDGIHGEGDSDYLGISLFAHQANKDGLYYEGSIGAGRVSNDYSSNDLVGAKGVKVHEKYDTDSTFVAAHLGLGKKIEVSDRAKLDVYGKYFYAHQGGDDATLATGETYHFDAVDSNRIRLGARYEIENGKAADSGKALNAVYVGTAYEYEFSGDAKATYKGMETASPSLKGSSGMLELGWKVKPSAASPLTIDLSANGWCGQKEGYGVKANLLWNF